MASVKIKISLTESVHSDVVELADKYYDGNVSAMIRDAVKLSKREYRNCRRSAFRARAAISVAEENGKVVKDGNHRKAVGAKA